MSGGPPDPDPQPTGWPAPRPGGPTPPPPPPPGWQAHPGWRPPPGWGVPPPQYPPPHPAPDPRSPGAYPPGPPPPAYPPYPSVPPGPGDAWVAHPATGPERGGPPARPLFPHPAPRSYDQILRTWSYSWWKPVVGLVVVALGLVLVAPLAMLPVLAVGVALEGGDFWDSFGAAATLQTVGPSALLYLNLTLGSMILVTWFVMRVIHQMRPRWLASVVPRIRWGFLAVCLGLSLVALVAQVLVSLLLPDAADPAADATVNDFTARTALLGLVVLLTTPLQAAGEEYVFRGYLLQAFGALLRHRWLAITASALLFGLAHGAQNFPLFFDRFMFGLVAGWLVVRTGGLEAGIAMHVLNNFLAFGFALAYSDLSETLNVSEISGWNIIVTLTQSLTYAALVAFVAGRMGLQTRTRPPAGPPYEPSVPVTAASP